MDQNRHAPIVDDLGTATATNATIERAADSAHAGIDRASEVAARAEQTIRETAARAADKAREVRGEAAALTERNVGRFENYVRTRPMSSVGLAVVAGMLASAILRR
jgi:ElaB/YqjD/DUF883 family membrane-anchored ribosome-binding protein